MRMDTNFDSNVSNNFPQNETWNNLPLSSSTNPHEQHHPCDLSPNIPELASSNTRTNATPLSASGTTIQHTPVFSPSAMHLLQDEIPRAHETAATSELKIGACQYSGADAGVISPAAKLNGRNIIVRTDGDVDHQTLISPSQFGKVNTYADLTSIGTVTRKDDLEKEQFGSSCLSLRDRLLLEIRSRTPGWPCHICHQRFKRRDYIRQHVKKKHPGYLDRLLYMPDSTPDQSLATHAISRSTYDASLGFGFLEGEQSRYPILSWNTQLNNRSSDSLQPNGAFQGGSITSQKMMLDLEPPFGRNFLDGSENRSSSCLEPSQDESARLFACPFYKHYPLQHQKCFSLSLRRPKDVKQHIYRSHTQPEFFCAMTEDQKKMLGEKLPRDLGVEDQWFQIYAIIFPVSKLPRSPYVGNLLEEIVPLLRQTWKTKCYEITAQASGNLSHHQLSFAMDLFFRTLESEAFGHEIVDNSICAAFAQSHMRDDLPQDTLSLVSAQSGY